MIQMQPYRLTVEGVVDPASTQVDNVVDTEVQDVTQLKLTISGDLAATSQGLDWRPYQCAYCSAPMDVGNDPCSECGKNNVIHTPLFWATAAEIMVEPETETVLFRLSLATGGFLQMEVHKSAADQLLIVQTPSEGSVQGGGETVTRIGDGRYAVRG